MSSTRGLAAPVRIRLQPPRCSFSRTACDFPAYRPGRGLSASGGDTAMRCTLLSCTLSLCTSSLCMSSLYTAPPPPPVAGPVLASALPCLSSIRARPCRVRAVVARLHRRSRGSKPTTSPSFDPGCLHRLAQKSFTATPCAACVPQSLAPHQSPQLLPRARACALQPRIAAPLPRCY
jgi:hypothetical protein